MRFLLRFEFLESTGIVLMQLDPQRHAVSRIFLCGEEHWVPVLKELAINVLDIQIGLTSEESIQTRVAMELANYHSEIRNLELWIPFPLF